MRRLRPSIRFPTSTRHFRRTFHRGAPNLFSNGQNTPEPVGMGFMASLLRSRAVVRFRGHDTLKFLHGLLTNDVRRFGGRSMAAPPMYTALLTPHGRFLYDMFVYRLDGFDSDGPFELLMDVDSSQVEEFLETFKRYRLRSKVEIENVTDEFSCWQCYGDGVSKKAPCVHEPDDTEADWNASVDQFVLPASQETNARLQWFRDPRLPCLGFRGIFPAKSTPPLVESAREVGEQNYLLWRVEHGVAEGSTEIPKELEDKVAPGLEVINMASDKKAGIVTSVFGCRGLGLLRLDDALKGGGTLAVQGQESVKVKGTRPEWWPSEWFQ